MVKINNMQRWGCVYRITNTVNSKKYIGQSVGFKNRERGHKCPSSNPDAPISKAIQKYGWEAFKVEIIIVDVPEEDLGNLEDSYMEVENTFVPNGYNVKRCRGSVLFDKQNQRWLVREHGEYIGQYFTKEKANKALKLYKETGERLASDLRNRGMGTGSIIKRGKRYVAQIMINRKRYSKTFDTPEQCEEWFIFMKTGSNT